MKVKELEIVGFKSFVEKTTVRFPEGICAVVGPNGCGKSNIVDALRWVMGEQSVKQLRGKSMEDVIFSGSEEKGPLNVAEVDLTLVNDNGNTPEEFRQFSEIMVSRRLFRSGESGYFINKQPCRLKDIQNLLMGTGVGSKTYAIIEQGKIGTLIDAGPEERRWFVEEAAGITRYKSRKHEALLKIKRTEQNLLRINDVILEIKRQMNSLKRQARKAERYKAYQEQIEKLEVDLATHRHKAIWTEIGDTEALLQSLRDTDSQHGSELAKLDAAIERIKQERAAKHESISEERVQSHSLQRALDKLEADIQYGKKDLERFVTEIDEFESEIEEIEGKNREIAEECCDLEERKQALKEDIQRVKETVKQEEDVEQTIKDELKELSLSLEAKKAELINLASRKATYQNTLENASKNKAGLSRRLDLLKKERSQTKSELAKLARRTTKAEDHHQSLKQNLDKLEKDVESLEERLRKKRQALSQQVRKVQAEEVERQKVRSRYGTLKKMDENYEWFREGVQAIMKQWECRDIEEAGICGLVADVIEPEPSYEYAVEAALGEILQHVVVKDQQGGMTAINSLRNLSGGRSSFVPIEAVKPVADGARPQPHDNDLLINHVRIKEGYDNLVQTLLGHVTVADNLEEALRLWNQNGSPHAIVTQQGDKVCIQGILTGGSADNSGSGILSKKKEVKSLAKQISRLDSSVAMAHSRQEQLETQVVALETQLQKARQEQWQESELFGEVEKKLYRLQETRKHTERNLQILNLEAQQIQGERTDADKELCSYQEVLADLAKEIQYEQSAVQQTDTHMKEASEKLDAVTERVIELKLELTTLQGEYDSSTNTLTRLKSFQHDRQDRMTQLERGLKQTREDRISTEQRLTRDQGQVNDLYAELQGLEERLAQSEAEYQTIEAAMQQNDQALSQVRTRRQETLQKIQQLELKQSERRMSCDHLVSRIQEAYHLDINMLAREHDNKGFSVEEAEKALAIQKDRIAKIGDVNLAAIHEYETLGERYRLLTEQRHDLLRAIETLHRVIRKINRVSLKKFMKTFKAVNEKVKMVFPKLFEGGRAELVLTNPRRPLESGVAFLVRPPGKKLTRMSLLSGGEKALAAIALVFSLFMIKPTSFCVLDEIDAPLDDANISRFNHLLREIGDTSQVVMVTHNKQTMEVADSLFGVTMEEKGVSKLVSLDLRR